MKRAFILIGFVLLLLITACSEKDNPTDTNIYGYSLDQFITKIAVRNIVDLTAADTTDFRSLFKYEIVSADADHWSPRSSVNTIPFGYDLNWSLFKQGFLVPSDNRKTWFPAALGLPNAYKVKNAGTVRLYRKVDVESGRAEKSVELKSLSLYPVQNWLSATEDAIKLSDLMQGIATADTIRLVAVDGYSKDYTLDQINDGYYLLTSEVTTFPTYNSSMTNSLKKFKKLARLEVIGGDAQAFNFTYTDSSTANISFTIPESMTGYQSTVLTDY